MKGREGMGNSVTEDVIELAKITKALFAAGLARSKLRGCVHPSHHAQYYPEASFGHLRDILVGRQAELRWFRERGGGGFCWWTVALDFGRISRILGSTL